MTREPRFLILAEGLFGTVFSKTANACLRYLPERSVAVIDSRQAGRTARDVLGYGGDVPVVGDLEAGLALRPTALLIGIAPAGGKLPDRWTAMLARAIEAGLDIWSGLHTFIADIPELAALARERGVSIRDLRRPPKDLVVADGRVRSVDATVVLTVGTDCAIGKMTVALEVRAGLRQRGHRVAFAGTGQTGILVEGWGIAVDAVIADFVAGAAERLVLDAARDADIVLVEGQGSIIHPSYSGVTYGLMHGSLPHAMILCAMPARRTLDEHDWVPIPPLPEMIRMHEAAMAPLRPSRVVALSLWTAGLNEADARRACERATDETGLPATDPVRFGPEPIVEAVETLHRARTAPLVGR